MLKLGSTEINKAYLGSIEINKIYLGSTLIYDVSLVDLLTGLQFVLDLEESSGSTAYDSHNSNDFTLDGTTNPTQGSTGKLGNCYTFDHTNKNEIYRNSISNSVFSMSMWVNVDTGNQATYGRIFSTEGYLWEMACGSTGGISIYNYANGWKFNVCSITLNTWEHIVLVMEATHFYIYINGTLEYDLASSPSSWTNKSLHYGIRYDGAQEALSFDLDQAAMWNIALDSDQVSALYNSGSGLAYGSWT